ncbi:MAG: anti-sigma factor antagonist [Planctomycetota bacterium]|nr:anti-sigma factor antagonist [Planctomycetota bacterium]
MSSADDQLKVFAVGKRTVLGFGGQEILSQLNVSVYRDHLVSLIEEHDIETVAFDLTGIALVPSGMLGLLASLREHNVSVEVYNPSDDVNDVLTITRLNELMTIKQGNPLDESESEDSDGE